jgi:hypothetical protein
MKIREFLSRLALACEDGYHFSLSEGVRSGPNGESLPAWVLLCDKVPGEKLRWGISPIIAVAHYGGLAGDLDILNGIVWIECRKRLGLSDDAGCKIVRSGRQIVCYDPETKKLRVKYSRKLRKDLLAACSVEERS